LLTLFIPFLCSFHVFDLMFAGKFLIKNVAPTKDDEASKIKVKVRINMHGIFSVTQASMVEKVQTTE